MLETHVSNLSMYPSIAGYSNDLDLTDVQPVSPYLAKPDSPLDRDEDVEALEDQALSAGMSASECEAQALIDELKAAALEVAIKAVKVSQKGLFDPLTGLVPTTRRSDRICPAVTFIRMTFQLATLRATVTRLRDRALRLRREADRRASIEAAQKSTADHTDAKPQRAKRRPRPVLLRDGKPVRPETAEQKRRRRFAARMAAAAHAERPTPTTIQFR